MYLIYNSILFFYAILYLPYLLLTQRGYAGFLMRFGRFAPDLKKLIKTKDNIWVHAVSVGEVMVAGGVIERLKEKYPSYQIVATVTTKTGYALACERLKGKAIVMPSPIDFSFVTASFVSLIKPKLYMAVETEIWPNLYRELYRKNFPMVVVNGRISDNSFGRYKAIRCLLKGILNQVQVWCMQSQRDADRIIVLGAQPSKVIVTGNIKFDDFSGLDHGANSFFVDGKAGPWWVAGSTHPGEEDIVLDVYSKIIKENPSWRLVIAPRHIERAGKIIELIHQKGFEAVRLSQIPGDTGNSVIVVDTIGQLRSLYSRASLVFVGKSLCVGGGHNVIEPAFYGKAIVVGPRFENFRDIVACFKEGNAILQVQDVQAFEKTVMALCRDEAQREALGAAAKKVITANQGATKRSLKHLAVFLK